MPVGIYNGPNVSTANGVATVFPYDFRVLVASEIGVYLDGVLQTTGFTVSGINNPSGGNVTFSVAPANGVVVKRERNIPLNRLSDYQRQGAFDEETVDKDFDRLEMQIQQIADQQSRLAIHIPSGETTGTLLPAAPDRSLKVASFDALGNVIATQPVQVVIDPLDPNQNIVTITQFMTDAQKADAQLATPLLDHASAMAAAIMACMGQQGAINNRGGEIYIPRGYEINLLTNPFGILPNDGTVGGVPIQASLRIYGAGMGGQATGTISTNGASQINFKYATGNNAKIDTRGKGMLEIDHLVLKDTSGNAEPFLFTSNTVVRVHHNEFFGSKAAAWDQDCIILGGTSTVIDETSDAPFQGYGSEIYSNHYHKIRRATYARVYANGVPIHHNTIWNDCGHTTGAPFVYDGDPLGATQTIAGIPLHHNLVELVNYKYGAMFRQALASAIGPNDFYDAGASIAAVYYFDGANALYNQVYGGYHEDTFPFVLENGVAVGKNSWINAHQTQQTVFAQEVISKNFVTNESASANVDLPRGKTSDASLAGFRYVGGTDVMRMYHNPAGAGEVNLVDVRDFGGGTIALIMWGSDPRVQTQGGALRFDNALDMRARFQPATDGLAGQSGALFMGAGAPNNANGSNGDFYFRTDGGAGTYIYKKAAGAWAGIV